MIRLCLINEGLADSKVVEINQDNIVVEIQDIQPAQKAGSKLIVGLSRPLTMQKVLEHGTTLGVKEFVFFKAELSEKSFLESKFIKEGKFQHYLEKGLAQAGVYCDLPKVSVFKYFSEIPLDSFSNHNKLFLSLNSQEYLGVDNVIKKLDSVFLIGPERGFTDDEEAVFQQLDFTPIKIGPSIQRVEYATATVLAQLEYFQNI